MCLIKKPCERISEVFSNSLSLYGENYQEQAERYEQAFEKFKAEINYSSAYVATSSGRAEIIDNHTNHNGGKVISSAISLDFIACFMPRTDGIINVISDGYNDGRIGAEEKAKIAQFSEREYFGKPCGLLDQTAISFGGLNVLDFKKEKITVTKIEDDLGDFSFVLVNTGGSYANLTDDYAAVTDEMFSVAKAMGVKRLIDVDYDTFIKRLPSIGTMVL